MERTRILVLGGSGYVGAEVVRHAPKNAIVWSTYYKHPPVHPNVKALYVDLFDKRSLCNAFDVSRPMTVICVARLGIADTDPKLATAAMRHLVEIVRNTHATLLYLSSDAVFDGQRGNYTETDSPHPITAYGQAKLAAEKIIREYLDNALIVRVGYIYGEGAGGIDKRTRQLLKEAQNGKSVRRFVDMYRSPINVTDLARAIWSVVMDNKTGIVHLGEPKQSVFAFNRMLAALAGLNPTIIHPASLNEREDSNAIAPDTSLDITEK